jgi:hypothetical protein
MGGIVAASPSPYVCGVSEGTCIVAFDLGLLIQAARGEDSSPELIQPAVCSPVKPVPPEFKGICEVTPLAGKRNKVKLNLTATTAVINVGGYRVETENYNGAYLSPVIEAMPGDTVAAQLKNSLHERRATSDRQSMAGMELRARIRPISITSTGELLLQTMPGRRSTLGKATAIIFMSDSRMAWTKRVNRTASTIMFPYLVRKSLTLEYWKAKPGFLIATG